MFHKIKSVAPLPGYRLLVCFACGCARQYDMSPLVSQPGPFRPLHEVPGLFQQVQVDPGGYGVSWNDTIDLACEELWENGTGAATPFTGLLSFSEATEAWQLNESTLRKAVAYHKLVEGVDVQKFGKQWVVTKAAMEREYGPSPNL